MIANTLKLTDFSRPNKLSCLPALSRWKPENSKTQNLRVALIGSYIPRQCGIATFTNDIFKSLSTQATIDVVDVIAVGDGNRYEYPPEVCFELKRGSDAYTQASEVINNNNYDIVFLQHEFGLFEGEAGCKLFDLLDQITVPLVTMLHTVLKHPAPDQLSVTKRLAALSSSVITMTNLGREFLENVYETPRKKISVIPHGIPDCTPYKREDARRAFALEGKKVAMTFGLIGPGKGLEYAVSAIPRIVESHPDFVYVLLGATHPNLIKEQGESYRDSLKQLAEELGVSKHLRFENRFVSVEELTRWIKATDVYVTPYLNEAQITSGTLSYAYGCGTPVVSTPYWHAAELLAEDRGCLVPFRDSEAIANSVSDLLTDDVRRKSMSIQARLHGRSMIWPAVAKELSRVLKESSEMPKKPTTLSMPRLREMDLRHLLRLTDDTGIVQHATCAIPNRHEGYCVDDNARALLLTLHLDKLGVSHPEVAPLQSRYAEFVHHAIDEASGQVRNFMSYSRNWLEDNGSPDSIARTAWTLGACVSRSNQTGIRKWAQRLLPIVLKKVNKCEFLRSWAFGLLAVAEYRLHDENNDEVNAIGRSLLSRLMAAYRENSSNEWPWFEDRLTYDNAKLPHAVMAGAHSFGHNEITEAMLGALRWLCIQQTSASRYFVPIGSDQFYIRGNVRSYFDQQPLEAWASVSACLFAYEITGDHQWITQANQAYAWFQGNNALGISMVDASTGGCFDGLHSNRVNLNQGAESTLSWLLADAEMRLALESLSAQDEAAHQLVGLRSD